MCEGKNVGHADWLVRQADMLQEADQDESVSDEHYFIIDGKRVAVVGSREYPNLEEVEEFIGSLPPDCTIVSGGAKGVDTAAKQAAKKWDFKYVEWPAEWNKYGKQAGFYRNYQIVYNCDIVVAFWDGYSSGTKHTIDIAREQGRRCIVITPE